MQINEIGKNRTNIGGIGDTTGKVKQKGQGETPWKGDRSRITEESFHDSLQKSMNVETFPEAGILGTGGESECMIEGTGRPEGTGRLAGSVISHKEAGFGKSMAEGVGVRVERGSEAFPAKEVEVRRIAYGECDKVEINVLEGYTLKAKLETDGEEVGTGGYRIYVEMKDDEGRMKACLFDGAGLQKDSRDVMERIAYAAMHNGEEG